MSGEFCSDSIKKQLFTTSNSLTFSKDAVLLSSGSESIDRLPLYVLSTVIAVRAAEVVPFFVSIVFYLLLIFSL